MRYLGSGEFISGVPARDLSAEEAGRYAAVIEANRVATGRALYAVIAHAMAEETASDGEG